MREIIIENLCGDLLRKRLKDAIQEDEISINYILFNRSNNIYSGKIKDNTFYFYYHYDKSESNFRVLINTWKERCVPTCLYGELMDKGGGIKITYEIEKKRYNRKFFKSLANSWIVMGIFWLIMGLKEYLLILISIVLFLVAFHLYTYLNINQSAGQKLENELSEIIKNAKQNN